METEAIIKNAIRIGNSSGVILPKSWENRKVRVELIEESIPRDVFNIIKKNNLLRDVMGIYIFGSYARGEERADSDIDVLIISGETNRVIKEANYEILIISYNRLEKNIGRNLYLYSIVQESKPIFNENLIKNYKNKKLEISLSTNIGNIKKMLKFCKESVDISKEYKKRINDGIIYSLVLRLRELLLIESFITKNNYSNKKLIRTIEENGSLELYEAYLRVKNDKKIKDNCKVPDAENLIKQIENLIIKVKNAKKRKKA